jgi:DnaJ-class molecular chaperone
MLKCLICKGLGLVAGTIEIACPACKGSGQMFEATCIACVGSGLAAVKTAIECGACHGTGLARPTHQSDSQT